MKYSFPQSSCSFYSLVSFYPNPISKRLSTTRERSEAMCYGTKAYLVTICTSKKIEYLQLYYSY